MLLLHFSQLVPEQVPLSGRLWSLCSLQQASRAPSAPQCNKELQFAVAMAQKSEWRRVKVGGVVEWQPRAAWASQAVERKVGTGAAHLTL